MMSYGIPLLMYLAGAWRERGVEGAGIWESVIYHIMFGAACFVRVKFLFSLYL